MWCSQLNLKYFYNCVFIENQHGEVSKQLAQSTKIAGDAVTEKEAAKSQLDELQQAQRVIDENRQCSTENTERERIELADRCQQLENENSVLSAQYEDVKAMATGDKAEFEATKDELKRKISVSLYFRCGATF